MHPRFMIAVSMLGAILVGCNQMTTANYRGDKADWSRPSGKPPIEVAACISDAWGQNTQRHKSLPNPKGQTLVLEGGPPQMPVVDAVVDVEVEGKGSVVRYGGRLRDIADVTGPWVEGSVKQCL